MSAHGNIPIWIANKSFRLSSYALLGARPTSAETPPAEAETDNCPSGFRHFLKNPDASQRFTIDGKPFDPSNPDQFKRAGDLMTRLGNIMQAGPQPKEFNTDIPSGYTYLLQLIAHDLVESSLFLSRSASGVLGLSNVRSKPLRLETIFGGSPIECPFAYEVNECGFRDRLRLGQVRKDGEAYNNNGRDFRDIARARATEELTNARYPEALIADGRNDSHAILSQLVVMFHHLQRTIVDKIAANANIGSTGSDIVDAQRNFIATQSACALIYRSIIRNDVLRKILHPKVRAAYEARTVPIIDRPKLQDDGPWLVPLEFSFGFFRFGHSMIRAKYSFNPQTDVPFGFEVSEILNHTSEDSPRQMPFENRWTIDWRRFFGDDNNTNFSVKIGPWSRTDLENAVEENQPNEPGLMVRDLTSSIATQPWSVCALAHALPREYGELLQLSPYLRGDLSDPRNPPWRDQVRRWLDEHRCKWPGQCLDDNDIATLATDPPIPFFVRFEAGLDPEIEGKHLGVLTSIIVADVFYGIFRDDSLLGVDGTQDLGKQLRQLSETVFGGMPGAFDGLEGLTTVNGLIEFLGDLIRFPTGG